jgi:DnaJ family protein A protein 5
LEAERAAAEYEIQDWQRIVESDSEDDEPPPEEQGDGTGIRLDDGAGGEVFECVACAKFFASEASWENHERSKKHKQAVYR